MSNYNTGKRIIRTSDHKQGTVLSHDLRGDVLMIEVMFDGGERSWVVEELIVEKLDGMDNDDRDFLLG